MDAAPELGKNPVSKHQIQPEYGDEQANAGRDCLTRLARPNSRARLGTGNNYFSLFSQLTTSRPYPVDHYSSLLNVMTIHICIHTYRCIHIYMHIQQQLTVHECTCTQIKYIPGI